MHIPISVSVLKNITYKSCSMHSKGLLHKPNEIIPSLNSKIHSLGGSYDHLGVFYIWETGLFDILRARHFLQKLYIQIHAHLRTTPEQWLLNPVG